MAYWLLKTEPTDYSIDDLEADGSTVWDGVGNNAALIHIRNAKPGDQCFIYHTGSDKAVMGIAKVTSKPYQDPKSDDEKRAVFDVEFKKRVKTPVTLKDIKADDFFADWALVKQGRLSVVPTTSEQWKKINTMAK
ncbi:MAG: EVE domain-containing protein [Planctomycetota bacterium]